MSIQQDVATGEALKYVATFYRTMHQTPIVKEAVMIAAQHYEPLLLDLFDRIERCHGFDAEGGPLTFQPEDADFLRVLLPDARKDFE